MAVPKVKCYDDAACTSEKWIVNGMIASKAPSSAYKYTGSDKLPFPGCNR